MPAENDKTLASELMLMIGIVVAILVGGWIHLRPKPPATPASVYSVAPACGPQIARASPYPGPKIVPTHDYQPVAPVRQAPPGCPSYH